MPTILSLYSIKISTELYELIVNDLGPHVYGTQLAEALDLLLQ